MSLRRRYRSYYASLLLVNMIIFDVVIFAFGIILFNALYRSESLKYLRKYDEVLSEIVSVYNGKHDNFYYMMFPLYKSIDDVKYLNRFLNDKTDTLVSTDPLMANKMIAMMTAIGERDKDIVAIYLSKSSTGSVFSFNCQNKALTRVSAETPFNDVLTQKNGRRMISGSQYITTSERVSVDRPQQELAFGIAGTLENKAGTGGKWSSILIAYKLESIESKVNDPSLDKQARYGMVTLDGRVIYDSAQQYGNTGYTLFPDMETVVGESDHMTLNGTSYLKNVYIDQAHGFAAFYYIPTAVVNAELALISAPVVMIVVAFCVISLLIYFVAVRLSGKRIKQLEVGMSEIGRHNLNYRIPIGRQNDELNLVAIRFNDMCDQLQDTINKVYLYNIKQKEAGFYALQTSINPHFLYNTLEAVRGKLSDEGSIDASEMIVMLSRLFEYQIKGATFVTVGEEIAAIELYVNFFDLRYDSRFVFISNIQDEILDYALPKYILQPILENYFIHGIRQSDDNWIQLSGFMENDDILLVIEDDGLGISRENLIKIREKLEGNSDDKSSFGLMNVHQRLRYVFDGSYGITDIESAGENKGTKITIKIKALSVQDMSNRIKKQ
ncbi:MAG: histidine kinase [Clostridiaceae bacterium]|nr:histidine kinase [Clostridiaceae bacterium]